MQLTIDFNEKYYKSDTIQNGRSAKKFFKELCSNIFSHAYNYATHIRNLTGSDELPLLLSERNMYSNVAVAIDAITPIHLSEWSFNKSEESSKIDKQRIVDFWCLNKEGTTGNPINYFIEMKTGYYCLTSRSQDGITAFVTQRIADIAEQLSELKTIRPEWNDFDNVYIGFTIIHNYYNGNDIAYSEDDLARSIDNSIDKRKGFQMITANWTLPENFGIQWEKDKVKSISIVGFILSKKTSK